MIKPNPLPFYLKLSQITIGIKVAAKTKLPELENKNNELKKKLADYKDDGQDKWIDFKNEFNHDMNELGKAFKDLTVENKK